MREFLFRGQTRRKGQKVWMDGSPVDSNWVEGYGVCMGKGDFSIIYAGDHVEKFVVYTDTVGQFTGLTDKNGKKIFEGDIVHCISRTDMAIMVVIFEDGEFRMVLLEKYKDYIPGCGFYAIRCFDKEIIGNIHDNPELLEVSDNG